MSPGLASTNYCTNHSFNFIHHTVSSSSPKPAFTGTIFRATIAAKCCNAKFLIRLHFVINRPGPHGGTVVSSHSTEVVHLSPAASSV